MMGYFKNIINDINRVSDVLPESSVLPMKSDGVSQYKSPQYKSPEYNSVADQSCFKQNNVLNKVDDNLHSDNINEVIENRSVSNENIPNEQGNSSCNENNNLYRQNKNNSALIADEKSLKSNDAVNETYYFNDGKNKEEIKENETVQYAESIKSSDDVEFENRQNNKEPDDEGCEKRVEPVFYKKVENNIDDLQSNIKGNEYRNKIIDAEDLGCQYNNKNEGFSQEIISKNMTNKKNSVSHQADSEGLIKISASSKRVKFAPEKRVINEEGENKTEAPFYDNRQADVNAEEGSGDHEKSVHPMPVNKTSHEIDDKRKCEADDIINETVLMRSKLTEVNENNKNNKLSGNNISENKAGESELSINKPDESNENKLSKKEYRNQPLVENKKNIKAQKENNYKVTGKKQLLGAANKKAIENPEKGKTNKRKIKTSVFKKAPKLVPDVIIGQIDIKIEAPPAPVAQSDSSSAMPDLSSRYYLRHL